MANPSCDLVLHICEETSRRIAHVKEKFMRAAESYMKRNKEKSAVLVIDNINRLALKDPDLLWILQNWAKDCADKKNLCIVFVSSEGLGETLLQSE